MNFLVDDLYGKISHILTTYTHSKDAFFILDLAKTLDSDVTISVAYDIQKKDTSSIQLLNLICDKYKNIISFGMKGTPPVWVQDAIHAYEGKILMSRFSEKFYMYPEYEDIRNTSMGPNILENTHWNQLGFSIIENPTEEYLPGGEIKRIKNNTYIGNDVWVSVLEDTIIKRPDLSAEIKKDIKTNNNEGILKDIRTWYLDLCKFYGGDGNINIISASNETQFKGHLDLYWHPHETGAFISNPHYVDSNTNAICPKYYAFEQNLTLLNNTINPKTNIPIVFPAGYDKNQYPIIVSNDSKSQQKTMIGERLHKIPFYAPINSLYEIFNIGNEKIKRVYVPTYSKHHEVKLTDVFLATKKSFESENFEVIPVPFYDIDTGGGLRCRVKVLEREPN